MAHSSEYKFLCQRLTSLRKSLLFGDAKDSIAVDAETADKTWAFVVLSHAEIEGYIESRCANLVKKVIEDWNKFRKPNRILFSIHAICSKEWIDLGKRPEYLSKKQPESINVENRINVSIREYLSVIENNHGIKTDNLKHLLVPLSIRCDADLAPGWLVDMENFGALRGRIAHNSINKITEMPDPKEKFKTLWTRIMPGIWKLDMELLKLENSF